MLINFMTKHVNIKDLQIQLSAMKKIPFYWLRRTPLPPWSRHQAMTVLLTVRRVITTVQPANPVPRCMCWPPLKDSGNPGTSPSSGTSSFQALEGKQIHRPGELQSYPGFPSVSQKGPQSLSFQSCCHSTDQLQGSYCSLSCDFESKIFKYINALGTNSQFEKWCLQIWLPSRLSEDQDVLEAEVLQKYKLLIYNTTKC